MNIANPHSQSLPQLLPLIQQRYPMATIKKPPFGPEVIFIPSGGFKYFLRIKGTQLKLDHTLPPLMAIVGALLAGAFAWYLMGLIQNKVYISGYGGMFYILILGATIGALIGGLMVGIKAIFRSTHKQEFEGTITGITAAIGHA